MQFHESLLVSYGNCNYASPDLSCVIDQAVTHWHRAGGEVSNHKVLYSKGAILVN